MTLKLRTVIVPSSANTPTAVRIFSSYYFIYSNNCNNRLYDVQIQSELNPLGLMPIGIVEFAIVLQDVDVNGSFAACGNDPRSLTESPLIPGSVKAVEELEQLLKVLTQLVQAGTIPGNKQIHLCKHKIIIW